MVLFHLLFAVCALLISARSAAHSYPFAATVSFLIAGVNIAFAFVVDQVKKHGG